MATEGGVRKAGKERAAGEASSAPDPETGALAELIARFQLQTETRIAEMRAEVWKELGALARQAGRAETSAEEMRGANADTRALLSAAQADVRAGVSEVNVALRQAVAQAAKASESAQVYEKLRESQPDFFAMVNDCRKKVGAVADAIETLKAQMNELGGRLEKAVTRLDKVGLESESNTRMLSNRFSGLVDVKG